jgi:hypothetical protein
MNPLVLSKEECCQQRTPDGLHAWLFEKMDLFRSLSREEPNLKRELLLRKGLSKQFYEEVYPLAFFAKHYFGGRTDVLVKWVPGYQNHDALILKQGEEPLFVEITQTVRDHKESLWEGLVSLTGKVRRERTEKTGIAIDRGFVFVGGEESRKRVDDVLRAKAEKGPGHYDPNTVLIILVDDYFGFVGESEWRRLSEIATGTLHSVAWPFRGTFFIGVSGKSFCGFPDNGMFFKS